VLLIAVSPAGCSVLDGEVRLQDRQAEK